ncbi:MAG TPA: RNA polymerase subunit sigma [Deltaproteobacteria bacterium]|nr:RNA polymerase subunit sigma [Deltaproteobacteria bacterium]
MDDVEPTSKGGLAFVGDGMRRQDRDDQALMAAIAAADSSALEELYDRHSAALLAICNRLLRDRGEAEDVLVEVFWEIWERARRYEPERGSPLAYLVTVARSRALDRLRRRRHEARVRVTAQEWVATLGPGPSGSGTAQDPLDDSLASEVRRRVRIALDALAPAQRQVVELSFLDGLSHHEIAEQLGAPLGTVKTWIRKGLLQLRDVLRLQYSEGNTV